jgi:Zn-finger nucleic acid-binding protein
MGDDQESPTELALGSWLARRQIEGVSVLAFGAGILTLVWIYLSHNSRWILDPLAISGAVVVGCAVAWILWAITGPRVAAERKRLLLVGHACVACGADLRNSPREGDDCIICPACGGAWRFGGGGRVMNSSFLHAKDDRGRRIPSVSAATDTIAPSIPARVRDAISIVLVDYVARALRIGLPGTGFGLVVGAMLGVPILGAIVGVLLTGAVWFGASRAMSGWTRSKLRRLALALRVCPACAESLAGIRPDDAGFTVCSGCGAAWALGDFVRTCVRCGYPLSGLTQSHTFEITCPECGELHLA